MTVSELITALSKFPTDAPVLMSMQGGGCDEVGQVFEANEVTKRLYMPGSEIVIELRPYVITKHP